MEATELIYLTMHQERYEDLKQRILLTYGAKYDKEQEQEFSARMDFLTQLQEDTEALLDFQEPRLRYFFERHATGGSGHCCLATVLVSSFNDIRQEDLQQAAQAMEERWRLLSGPGFEISEISYSGLTYCRCPQDQTPPLHEQINRLEQDLQSLTEESELYKERVSDLEYYKRKVREHEQDIERLSSASSETIELPVDAFSL